MSLKIEHFFTPLKERKGNKFLESKKSDLHSDPHITQYIEDKQQLLTKCTWRCVSVNIF